MIEIVQTGPLALIQDLGRFGYTDLGVGRSGAFDTQSHRLANRLVGNNESAATIELTLGGMAFRLVQAATLALTGAQATLSGSRPLDWNTPITLPAGSTVEIGAPPKGLRSYLAVRGGLASTAVLGSRSTDTLSGLGPPSLRNGDVLPIGTDTVDAPSSESATPSVDQRPLRMLLGPRTDWFVSSAIPILTSASWTVATSSNRVGIRLTGPMLERSNSAELPSEPTLPGAIQVPLDGQPIILGPDAPVTGGYPVIAVLATDQLSRLAQVRPGDEIRLAEYAI
jgi:biotin-dependent carboxylase-like uncharacterized protein